MQYRWNHSLSDYVVRAYGGRKALLLLGWSAFRDSLGAFGPYRSIDWRRVSRIVFVCKGNICRSAFAAGRFRAFGLEAASAGLEAESGREADPRAVAVARRFGVDLGGHRSTPVSDLELGGADLLVAFEPGQAERLRHLPSGPPAPQVTLLGLWSSVPGMAYIHDPYGLPETYFEACFQRIERGLEGLRRRCPQARTAREQAT